MAGLLVGRAAMRQREVAVRLSLGFEPGPTVAAASCPRASSWRSQVAQLVCWWRWWGSWMSPGVGFARLPAPLELDFVLDRRVLIYALGLSTATSVFFGLLPARSALRVDLVSSLKDRQQRISGTTATAASDGDGAGGRVLGARRVERAVHAQSRQRSTRSTRDSTPRASCWRQSNSIVE